MDMTRHRRHRKDVVPQSEALPNSTQVENNAQGFVWEVDIWKQLVRFLILGTERGTYYVSEGELTVGNVAAVEACIQADPQRVLASIAAVTDKGLAAKHDARLYALALLCAQTTDTTVKQQVVGAIRLFCPTAQQLFTFVKYWRSLRGNGRMFRRLLASWYSMPVDRLAYQMAKYPARDDYNHRDLLRFARMAGAEPGHQYLFKFARAMADGLLDTLDGGPDGVWSNVPAVLQVSAAFRARGAAQPVDADLVLIRELRLPRESLPTEWLNHPGVWAALLDHMPMAALVRNLGNLTKHGVLVPFSPKVDAVCERLRNLESIRLSKLHPLQVLAASFTYQRGASVKGSGTWEPVAQIVDALQDAFHLAFHNVVASGKRILVAVDVSGSMWSNGGVSNAYGIPVNGHFELDVPKFVAHHWGNMTSVNGMDYLTAAQCAAVMATVIAATEAKAQVVAFDTQVMTDYPITGRTALRDALNCGYVGPRGTDCAAPITWAADRGLDVDAFVILTDNETWAGAEHPAAALERYRKQRNMPDTRLAVVAMAANQFTITAPDDARSMDFIGFDPGAPAALATFLRGTI